MFNLLEGVITMPLIVFCVALFIILILLAFFCDTNKFSFDTKSIAFAGITVATSVGLSFIKLFVMPLGGDITLASILPILLYSFIYGTKKGVLIAIIFGLINFIIFPFSVHPAQIILDYPVAFGFMGLSSVFGKIKKIRNKPILEFVLGSVTACIFRFICHVIAGRFAYETPFLANIAYNSFVFVDLAIAVFIGIILLSSKSLLRLILERRKNNSL